MKPVSTLVIASIIAFCACKKTESPLPVPVAGPAPETGVPLIKPHGQPTGDAVKRNIGPEGGTLTSADRLLVLTVPAGAVAATTEFSIQPVENELDTVHPAFRLLPASIVFSKPVTLTWQYGNDNLQGNDPRLFRFAYQDEAGAFHRPQGMVHNVNTKTFSIQTTHFSDWTITKNFEIAYSTGAHRDAQNIAHLQAGQHLGLHIDKDYATKDDSSELVLADLVVPEEIKNAEWKIVAGPGSIINTGDDKSAIIYFAPVNLAGPADVLISATLNGNFGKDNLGNPIRQIILLQTIKLDAEYFTVSTEDGGQQNLTGFGVTVTGNGLGISGSDDKKGVYLVMVYGDYTATYAFGAPNKSGEAYMEYDIATGSYRTYRPKVCNSEQTTTLVYSQGAVTLTHIASKKGEYTTGSVGGATLCVYNFCDASATSIKSFGMSAKFSILKKD